MPKQNIGHDLDISISIGGQVVKSFGLHTSSDFKPDWSMSKVTPTNEGGRTSARAVFKGWDFTLTYARVNGTADNIAQFLEDTYKAGGADPVITMLQTVTNADQTVDQYRYLNGTATPVDAGDYKGVDEVNGSIKFFFSERQLVSSGSGASTLGGQSLSS